MQLMQRAPVQQYFIAMFLAVSALFFLLSSLIYQNYTQAQRVNDWTLYNYEVVRQSRQILLELVDMETGVRGYILSQQKKFLEPYQQSQTQLYKEIGTLRVYTKQDDEAHARLDQWLEQITRFSQTLDEQVAAARQHGRGAVSQASLARQKAQMDDLRATLEGFTGERMESLRAQISRSREVRDNFAYILGGGTVLAVGGMLLATVIILALLRRSKASEQEARDLEERFLTVMAGVNDGIYDHELSDGELMTDKVYFSPSYKAMLGYTDDEYPNRLQSSVEKIHPDDRDAAIDNARRYIAGEQAVYNNLFRMQHKDGHWIWILSRGVGMRDKKGRITRIIGTHTDITEQKKREDELA